MERLPPGKAVGRYELVARLGEGAMGIVYLGRSRGGDLVAVKVMKDLWVADPDYRARFRREIGAARRVNGLYTAAPLDFDADAPAPWLATRYLPGLSLRDAVRRHGAGLPPPALRGLAAGLAEALSAIHAAGVVHRDLKPENVLLTADGPRVIDFGIARPDDATFLTVPGGSRFTREYSAPEQAAGGPVGAAGDVFALGAVVLFAAGARDPFGAGPPRSAPDLSDLTDPVLRRIVAACLRWEPRRRPSARQVLDRLGDGTPALSGSRWLPDGVADEIDRRAAYALDLPSLPAAGPTPASVLGAETLPPPQTPVPAGRPGPRRRTLLVGAAALGVLAVAGTALGTGWRRGGGTPGRTAGASGPAAPSPTTPPVATERWRTRVSTTYPELDLAVGLVLAWSDTRLRGLDPATGRTRWSRTARLGGAGVAKGAGGTPLRGGAADGTAYLLDNAAYPWALSAVRAASGAVAWRRGLAGYPFSGLVRAGDLLVLAVSDEALQAIGADDGAARWSSAVDASGGLAAGGTTLVAVGKGAMSGLSAATGRRVWRYGLDSGRWPVVTGDVAVVSDTHGTAHAVRLADGTVVWRRPIGVAGPMPSAAGLVYATTGPGTTYALRAATGATVWRRRLGTPAETAYGYPSVLGHARGTLYVGGNDRTVYALDAATGRPRWTYPAEVALTTAPVATAGLVFIGTRDGYVRALVPPNGGDRAGA